ncbi:MAG: 6-phosphofructokinase [Alphaproteobacteria bacterium]|nr:6-phosphofructokinase [Alphaproteobacteria bacterium]
MTHSIRRVAILFSGGPAPAANAVISAAAISFLEHGIEVVGIFHGYSNLCDYDPTYPLEEGLHYRIFRDADLRGIRNSRGICIGTARANPGKGLSGPADLDDEAKTARLRAVHAGLRSLGIDALVSIGGDDTLKTANFLQMWQRRLPAEERVAVVHLPKTIDNDYRGIDFTFGFFTAVDVMAKELQNLAADADATSGYFIVETMGRKAGWLSYGVGIAGEASMVVAVEDARLHYMEDGFVDLTGLADAIVDCMVAREMRGRHSGTIVVAEGIGEMLPEKALKGVQRDDHGHISLGKLDLHRLLAEIVKDRFKERTGRAKKVTGVQLGYESRCAPPHAFDVMLGSQLGIGAYRALVEEGLDGFMVSVSGQLDLVYVPFDELIDPATLVTEVRFIEPESDFYRLARLLESRTEAPRGWVPGPRREP